MEHHILVIDDDTQELRRLRELLTRGGYNIMTATDRETARKILEKVSVGFILMKNDLSGDPSFDNDAIKGHL